MKEKNVKKRATKLWLEIACLTGILATVMIFGAGTVYADDLEGVKQRGVLRHLGIPYAGFITGSGDGMDVELMQRFAKHLGVRYEFLPTDWTDIFGDLTGNKVRPKGNDIEFVASVPIKGDVAANGITVLPWREKAVNFSLPTFPNQVWLVARSNSPVKPIKPSGNLDKDIATVKRLMKGKSLLGKTGTCLDPSLYNLQEVTNKIKLFPGSLNDMAPAIINGETELSLLDVPDALVALQKWPGKIKVIGPVSEIQDMAVAFSKDSPELLAEFNRFLDKSKNDGSFVQLAKKYYPFVANYYPKFFAR
jgi:ABC-type amino acid transport substrate-binding protein